MCSVDSETKAILLLPKSYDSSITTECTIIPKMIERYLDGTPLDSHDHISIISHKNYLVLHRTYNLNIVQKADKTALNSQEKFSKHTDERKEAQLDNINLSCNVYISSESSLLLSNSEFFPEHAHLL